MIQILHMHGKKNHPLWKAAFAVERGAVCRVAPLVDLDLVAIVSIHLGTVPVHRLVHIDHAMLETELFVRQQSCIVEHVLFHR